MISSKVSRIWLMTATTPGMRGQARGDRGSSSRPTAPVRVTNPASTPWPTPGRPAPRGAVRRAALAGHLVWCWAWWSASWSASGRALWLGHGWVSAGCLRAYGPATSSAARRCPVSGSLPMLIAGLAFDDPVPQDQARVGVLLAAVLAGLAGWEGSARRPRRRRRPASGPRPAGAGRRGPRPGPGRRAVDLVEYGDLKCPFCARPLA